MMYLGGNSLWLLGLHEREKKEGWGPHNFGIRMGPCGFGQNQDHAALGCSLLPHGLGSRRDLAGKERGERTLAGGP